MALEGTLHRLFCQKLRAIRKANGITQEQMAERMGITQPSYCSLENGRFAPIIGTIEKAALALGVKPEELLSAKKVQPSAV